MSDYSFASSCWLAQPVAEKNVAINMMERTHRLYDILFFPLNNLYLDEGRLMPDEKKADRNPTCL